MAIIRAKGLFEGERLAACSDEAQKQWPRLYLLGNGHSRFEVNHERIIAVAYGSFHLKPTAEDVSRWLREYADHFLLFLYEDPTTGAMWGQWITAQQNLATYRTAEDNRSPAPNEKDIDAFRYAYVEQKRLRYRKTRDILKPPETVANHPEPSESVSVGEGVGVGDGIGEGTAYRVGSEKRTLLMSDPAAQRAYDHLKAGSIRGLSIGYTLGPGEGKVTYSDDGTRTLKEVFLHEISLCAVPANPGAVVTTVKSLTQVENVLRTLRPGHVTAADLDQLHSIDLTLKALLRKDGDCSCECDDCVAGNCEDCSDQCAECEGDGCAGCVVARQEAAEVADALKAFAAELKSIV